jgi:threonine aldolase
VDTIDLRSDTVTRPSPAMRQAMASALVGDDVHGEDPTVNRLQEQAARLLGKEVALFFPSGTMANQASLRVLTRPGDIVIGAKDCHVLRYEAGAAAALSGLQIRTIGERGCFEADDVRRAIQSEDLHSAPTSVLALENTHNVAGGRVFPPDLLEAVTHVAREAGLRLHLDGARLCNAAVACGRPLAELAAPFDTVSVCLSKGLGAPVGSVVATSRERLTPLLRIRKMMGGGMRQVGLLAAAGIHALEHNVERLAEDHANARRLAAGLAELGFPVEETPETNIVMFRVDDEQGFLRTSRERGVLINPMAPGRFRAVTHLDVSPSDVEDCLGRLAGLGGA